MQECGKLQTDRMIRHLSSAQLRRIRTALYSDKVGWQSRVSEALGESRGAVTRWLSGATRIPTPASLAHQYMLRDRRSQIDRSSGIQAPRQCEKGEKRIASLDNALRVRCDELHELITEAARDRDLERRLRDPWVDVALNAHADQIDAPHLGEFGVKLSGEDMRGPAFRAFAAEVRGAMPTVG